MNEQISQALAVLQTVVNAATQKGVFATAQEAAVADAAVKLLIKAATPPEAEAEAPVEEKPKRKSKVEKVK